MTINIRWEEKHYLKNRITFFIEQAKIDRKNDDKYKVGRKTLYFRITITLNK